jgi:hypothetical protein
VHLDLFFCEDASEIKLLIDVVESILLLDRWEYYMYFEVGVLRDHGLDVLDDLRLERTPHGVVLLLEGEGVR